MKCPYGTHRQEPVQSLPSRERGLKCKQYHQLRILLCVAPFAGAWIEIKRGMLEYGETIVAPFAGAWIEINASYFNYSIDNVAPFAGAWIEIEYTSFPFDDVVSLPSRERGLKLPE